MSFGFSPFNSNGFSARGTSFAEEAAHLPLRASAATQARSATPYPNAKCFCWGFRPDVEAETDRPNNLLVRGFTTSTPAVMRE